MPWRDLELLVPGKRIRVCVIDHEHEARSWLLHPEAAAGRSVMMAKFGG